MSPRHTLFRKAVILALAVSFMSSLSPRKARADFMDAYCFVSAAVVTIWPIGTALAGPSVIRCTYHYFEK